MTDIRENVEQRINQVLTNSSIQLNTTQEIETETGNRKEKTGSKIQKSGSKKQKTGGKKQKKEDNRKRKIGKKKTEDRE